MSQRRFASEAVYDPFLPGLETAPQGYQFRPSAHGMDYQRFAKTFAQSNVPFEHGLLHTQLRAAQGIESTLADCHHMSMSGGLHHKGPQFFCFGRTPGVYACRIPAVAVGLLLRLEVEYGSRGRAMGMNVVEVGHGTGS